MSARRAAIPGLNATIVVMLAAFLLSLTATPQDQDPGEAPANQTCNPMTAERLAELIVNVDEEAQFNGSTWIFRVADLEVGVVHDVAADRMRIIIPIGPADAIPNDELVRIMQANFDSALDARYAIAQGQLWGTYIHPLSELSDDEFLTAIGESVNIVLTYGTSYSSGLLIFGGGDSVEIQQRELIERLRKKRI